VMTSHCFQQCDPQQTLPPNLARRKIKFASLAIRTIEVCEALHHPFRFKQRDRSAL
jgi:hypothetical protein